MVKSSDEAKRLNSGTGYVRNLPAGLSLDSLFYELLVHKYLRDYSDQGSSHYYLTIPRGLGFNNCTNSVYASLPSVWKNAPSLECSFGTKLKASQAI